MLTGLGIAVVFLLVVIAFELYLLVDHGIAEILFKMSHAMNTLNDIERATNGVIRALSKQSEVAMPYAHRYMNCKNPHCGSPIQLPHPTIASIDPTQLVWPNDDWKQSFLCFYCGHIYEYSVVDVQHCLESTHNPYEVIPYATYSIRFACDEYNCGISTKTHVIVPAPKTSEDAEIVVHTIARTSRHWLFQYECPTKDHSPKLPETTQIEIRPCLFPS
jgi:hypothetical protein